MGKVIVDPVPWVTGYSRLTVETSDDNRVLSILFEPLEKRGLEKVLKGRSVELLPTITPSICGSDSWSHYIASIKALDIIYGRKPPLTAIHLREAGLLLDILESHLRYLALKFAPKYIGGDVKPLVEVINDVRVVKEIIGGRTRNPIYGIAGGVTRKPGSSDVEVIMDRLSRILDILEKTSKSYMDKISSSREYTAKLSNDKYRLKNTGFIALLDGDGKIGYYDGRPVILGPDGSRRMVDEGELIDHLVVSSRLGTCELYGGRNGEVYMVGAISRINLGKTYSEDAEEIIDKLVELSGGKPLINIFVEPIARLVESLDISYRLNKLFRDPSWLSGESISFEGKRTNAGLGVVESSRGLVIHKYGVSGDGLVDDVEILDPSGIRLPVLNKLLEKYRGSTYSSELLDDVLEIVKIMDLCIPGASKTLRLGGVRG